MISVTKFFGDAERTFCLTDLMIQELERLTGTGIGALYLRAVAGQFALTDIVETIRLALIGGGASPQMAADLVQTYGHNRPMAEIFPLALDILDARWSGTTQEQTE